MTPGDSNCEVMENPHNESGGVRENLQNDRVRVFRDTPDCLQGHFSNTYKFVLNALIMTVLMLCTMGHPPATNVWPIPLWCYAFISLIFTCERLNRGWELAWIIYPDSPPVVVFVGKWCGQDLGSNPDFQVSGLVC